MRSTVAIVQFSPDKGQVAKNLDRICEAVIQAAQDGATLVVLPETAVSGYFLEGGVVENALSSAALVDEFDRRLVDKLKAPVTIVCGYYEESDGQVYNSAATIRVSESAELVSSYRKFFLPTYGVFDEERFVSRGSELGLVTTGFGKSAVMICEDVWHSVWPTLHAMAGARIMIIPSASPARGFSGDEIGNHDRYRRLVRAIAEEHGVYCILAQLTGFEGGKGFIGGSMIVDPFGQVLVEAPVGKEAIITAQIDLNLVPLARAATPLLSDLQSVWPTIQKLVNEQDF